VVDEAASAVEDEVEVLVEDEEEGEVEETEEVDSSEALEDVVVREAVVEEPEVEPK
jgi:hypothetical protein